MKDHDLHLIARARDAGRTGEGLRWREAAGFSQSELATVLGVSPATVSRWESGRRRPRGPVAIKYGRLMENFPTPDRKDAS